MSGIWLGVDQVFLNEMGLVPLQLLRLEIDVSLRNKGDCDAGVEDNQKSNPRYISSSGRGTLDQAGGRNLKSAGNQEVAFTFTLCCRRISTT